MPKSRFWMGTNQIRDEKEDLMHLYWRVIEELKYLNETWIMTDPSLSRSYKCWVRKNASVLFLADTSLSLS